jgi:hypothetical protein
MTLHDCAHADVRHWPWTGDAERHILQLLAPSMRAMTRRVWRTRTRNLSRAAEVLQTSTTRVPCLNTLFDSLASNLKIKIKKSLVVVVVFFYCPPSIRISIRFSKDIL